MRSQSTALTSFSPLPRWETWAPLELTNHPASGV